ncbi:MAG: GNAT family N-acetyltransferase [Anaerolineales bacterium]|nr:GNAT family N-acetyltransferase [Anaerolineales bacterium]
MRGRVSNILITPTLPTTPEVRALIAELETALEHPAYPPESQYGYSVEKLVAEGVAFFVIWVDGEPAGCGGIQFYGEAYGELKRMYVRPQFRGLGLGKKMIEHLEEVACQRGVNVLRLETGTFQHEAIGLYEKMGFKQISAFGEYRASAVNVFYEKRMI